MDLRVPIALSDELTDEVVQATGLLDLASGEIHKVAYTDYDSGARGFPWEGEDYEFSCGTISNNGKDVEFSVEVHRTTGVYSVSATELLEIKVRAAALFSGIPAAVSLEDMAPKAKPRAAYKR